MNMDKKSAGIPVWLDRTTQAARPLGLVGGLTALVASFMAIALDGLYILVVTSPFNFRISLSLLAISWALMAIMGSVMTGRDPKVSGAFLIAGAVGGLVTVPTYLAIPAIPLLLAGILFFVKKAS